MAGGTLTNWRTIRARIETLKKLERARDNGDLERLPKKEALITMRKIEKLQERLGGLREMRNLPSVLIVVDTDREMTAVKEANTLGIPVLGIVDTNGNPDVVDYIIPGNDDAMRSIRLLVSAFSEAVLEGRAMRGDSSEDAEETGAESAYDGYDDDATDDDLLGASTLKKLRDQRLFEPDEEES